MIKSDESIEDGGWEYSNGKLKCLFEIFSEEFTEIEDKILNKSRWMTYYRKVVSLLIEDTMRYFALDYGCPSTENSGDNEFDLSDVIEATEVFKKEIIKTVYV